MNQELKKRILKSSVASSIGTLFSMVFQFFTIMLIVRYTTKEDMGIYSLVMVVVNMFTLLSGLGLELTMVKSISSINLSEKRTILPPILLLRAIGNFSFSIIFMLVGRYVLNYFDDRIYDYMFYIIAIFILASFRDLFYNLMQGLNQFRNYSLVNVFSSIFRIIMVGLFIFLGTISLQILLIIEILATAQPLIHQLSIIQFKDYINVWPSIKIIKRVIKFSFPLYLNNLFVFINGRVNVFIIGLYLSVSDLASYSVAENIPMALKKLFSSFIIVYFPNLAKLFSANDKRTAIDFVNKSQTIFSLFFSFIVLITFVFKNEITILLYSEKYSESALTAALLIVNFQFRGMADLFGYSFTPAGHPTIPAKVNSIASIVSAISSFILIPYLGFVGAAISLIIMNLLSFFMFYIYLCKYDLKPRMFNIFKPIIIMISILFLFYIVGIDNLVTKTVTIVLFPFISYFFVSESKGILKSVYSKSVYYYKKVIR
ncbi:MAG: flippase [Ignavibacteriaceae bacterium]